MHNGFIAGLPQVRRDLALAVDPSLFPEIEGTTDTELLFHLSLTYGLEEDPPTAVARAVGLVEAIGRRHGVDYPIQMTVATTDGDTTWAFRYSSEGRSRSLFHSTDVSTLRDQYPENPVLHELSDDARLIVSEPLGDLYGAWREVPESTCVVVHGGREELRPFAPAEPALAA
jgi:glutamine amidotransferase